MARTDHSQLGNKIVTSGVSSSVIYARTRISASLHFALLALFLGLSLDAVAVAPSASNSVLEIKLRGKLKSITMIGDSSAKVYPADLDPRFAIALQIISVEPAVAEFHIGEVATFAIHSPGLVFAGRPQINETYDLSLCRETHGGKVKMYGLHLRLPPSGKSGNASAAAGEVCSATGKKS